MGAGRSAQRVTIVDYGLGNLFSLQRALKIVGAEVEVTADPDALRHAAVVIVPGVGAFGDGMEALRARGLIEPLRDAASAGRPILGICLGMQLLFSDSEEFGRHIGLGFLRGSVVRLRGADTFGRRVKVPHVGWSELEPPEGQRWVGTIFEGLAAREAMYFVHSYIPVPEDETIVIARMTYGGSRYCAAVARDNLVGCQFHPEKSGEAGLRLLRTFVGMRSGKAAGDMVRSGTC